MSRERRQFRSMCLSRPRRQLRRHRLRLRSRSPTNRRPRRQGHHVEMPELRGTRARAMPGQRMPTATVRTTRAGRMRSRRRRPLRLAATLGLGIPKISSARQARFRRTEFWSWLS
jgi:hypothetical protein